MSADNTNSGAKLKMSTKEMVDAAMNGTAKATPQQKQEVQESATKFANIKTNTFFKIAFDPSISEVDKPKAVTAAIDAAESAEDLAELAIFKAYMSELQINMASEVIKMSDPTNFAIVRDVVEEMDQGLHDINNALDPLIDILDAFEEFNGPEDMVKAFTDIRVDRNQISELEAQNLALTNEFDDTVKKIRDKQLAIEQAKNDRGLFGQKKEAKILQTTLEFELAELAKLRDAKAAEQVANRARAAEYVNSTENKLQNAQRTLREMLDTSSETHVSRGQELIDKALSFIEKSKANADIVIEKKTNEGKRIGNLDKISRNLTTVFTVIDQGSKAAIDNSLDKRVTLETPVEGETPIEKITRESKLRKLNEKIEVLNNSNTDTNKKIVSLAADSIMIDNMKQQNRLALQQIEEIRAEGIATVASNLSTVAEAIGAAATNQAKNVISATMGSMNARIDRIAGRQSIKTAMGVTERDAELRAAVERLASIGDIKGKATELANQGLAALRKTNEDMAATAARIADMQKNAGGAVADSLEKRGKTLEGVGTTTAPVDAAPTGLDFPFDLTK